MLPALYQTVDRQNKQQIGEWGEVLNSSYFPHLLLEMNTEVKEEWILDSNSKGSQNKD